MWERDEVAETTTLKDEFLDDYFFIEDYGCSCCYFCWDCDIMNPSYSSAVVIGKIFFLAVLGVARYLIGIEVSFS